MGPIPRVVLLTFIALMLGLVIVMIWSRYLRNARTTALRKHSKNYENKHVSFFPAAPLEIRPVGKGRLRCLRKNSSASQTT